MAKPITSAKIDPHVGAAGGGCKQEAAWRPPTDQAIVCVLKATNQMDM